MTKTVLITGASSGIGAALALAHARDGARLFICGRDPARLRETAEACRARGAEVDAQAVDVADRAAMRAWIEAADDAAPLDLVIANAGLSGGDSEETARAIFDVNVTGVLNTIYPALDRMETRGAGQIAIVSSIAGNRGFPSAPAYSASKAAVLALAEGLRGQYAPRGIKINAICPGFVRSRITDKNDFPMPYFMEADRAAQIIVKGLAANHAKISFPWQMRLMGWISRALPSGLGTAMLSRLPAKEARD
jgi:short-subunit dehydrogenase